MIKRFTAKIKMGDITGNILECLNCSKIETCKNEVNYRNTCLRATIDHLAELEDKIENGTLIELPCMIQNNDGEWLVYFLNTMVFEIDYFKYDDKDKDKAEEHLKELKCETFWKDGKEKWEQ